MGVDDGQPKLGAPPYLAPEAGSSATHNGSASRASLTSSVFPRSPTFSKSGGFRLALPVLLTSMLVMVTPPALGAGLGWVLARDRSGARAALLIGLLGASFSFLFYDLAVTRAVHTSRVAAAASAKTPQFYLGSDLSFTDLGAAISVSEADAAARPSRRCPCANCSR